MGTSRRTFLPGGVLLTFTAAASSPKCARLTIRCSLRSGVRRAPADSWWTIGRRPDIPFRPRRRMLSRRGNFLLSSGIDPERIVFCGRLRRRRSGGVTAIARGTRAFRCRGNGPHCRRVLDLTFKRAFMNRNDGMDRFSRGDARALQSWYGMGLDLAIRACRRFSPADRMPPTTPLVGSTSCWSTTRCASRRRSPARGRPSGT